MLSGALLAVSALIALPAVVLSVEVLAALIRPRVRAPLGARPRSVVLIPAHDEEQVLEATLDSVCAQLADGDRVLVVADNCSDRTAEVARSRGVEVLERFDRDKRGKGFALTYGSDHLARQPPEVLVIIDADCWLGEGALDVLTRRAVGLRRPVQADNLSLPAEKTARSAVSGLAVLVRNRIRPLGLRAMGFGTQMTGTGMAFPWEQWRRVPGLEGFLAEDLLLGVELTRLSFPPFYERDAEIRSTFPADEGAQRVQRQRWEQGQLTVLLSRAPRLVLEGLLSRRMQLVAAGLDLSVPPLAAWFAVATLWLFVALAAGLLGGGFAAALLTGAGILGAGAAIVAAWSAFGRDLVPGRHLLAVPGYVLWKIPMYAGMLVRRTSEWVRTPRDS